MKTYNKIFAAVALAAFMGSCAEQEIDNYYVDKPDGLDAIEALNSYGNIKDYLDRTAYPNFKIACALGANDYNERGIWYRVANRNFDEITLGNAMKYASVVGDDGTMTFTTINELLDNAEAAGMSVYGHTLAWHAQQNVTWLKSLLADAHVEIKPEDKIMDADVNFSDYASFPFEVINGFTPTIEDGVLKASISNKKHQFYLTDKFPTEVGKEYEIVTYIRADKKVQINVQFGDKTSTVKIPATTEWSEVTIYATAVKETSFLMVDPGNTKADIEMTMISVGHYPPSSRPLSEQEKYDNLVAEANRWVGGMMEACNGRVQAWDLVNEAISGGGNIDGYYDLQHAEGGGANDFFWQDYLGNENYVPVFEAAARKAFAENGGNPSDLKLFVNDYNLESDWDNNHKLKSMIYWIGKWEAKGAKIDGVSSQMHISYYENKNIMSSKAKHMVNMLHLMADTKRLVRISELDMGYVDINGNDVPTSDMTPEQHQNMANYYRFIIQMFLKIVPKDQQYSICQWCLTDAPASSGWRANTPVGLWTQEWQRKQAYVAYCEALQAPLPQTEDFFEYLQANNLTHYMSK